MHPDDMKRIVFDIPCILPASIKLITKFDNKMYE